MSASERLRALDERRVKPWLRGQRVNYGVTERLLEDIGNALPLIADGVAQLEEAESAFSYIAQTLEMNDRPEHAAAHARLHAKRSHEALTSLKEHLDDNS